MIGLSDNMDIDETFDSSASSVMIAQSGALHNGSINSSADLLDHDSDISNETMRLLFITIAAITVLACLSICLSVCICVCLNRRRTCKRQEKKDRLLLPEQSEKISPSKPATLSPTKQLSTHLNLTAPSSKKPHADKKYTSLLISSQPTSSSSDTVTIKATVINPYYYDNLDDIPYIDESRPTSFIDVTRV